MKLKRLFYSVLTGVLAGLAAAIFLYSLDFITLIHKTSPWLVWLLPIAGLVSGILYLKFSEEANKGTGLILEEIHDPKKILPLFMAPLVYVGTLLTHLTGGSAGREGTAVQMGATLADQLNKFFNIDHEERKILLVAGAGAGFSAAIGAPLAGTLFGLEVIQIGKLRAFALMECAMASFISYYTVKLVGIHHTPWPKIHEFVYDTHTMTAIVVSGLIFGIAANVFIQFTHLVESLHKNYVKTKWLFPFVGGIVLLFMFSFAGTNQFRGLGLEHIQQAFLEKASWTQSLFKGIFTAVTVGSGFKGGEFIPLVYIGSTLGSFLSGIFHVSRPLLAGVGFAAVFGAAANTPIACAIMAAELFGWKVLPHSLLACWVAYYLSGHIGIYKNQRLVHSKKDQLLKVFTWPANMLSKLLK